MSNPIKKTKNISCCKIVLSYENIAILIKYPIALDRKYVWIPNIKIPTKDLKKPKYLAPLIPNDDLNNTAKGRPNFWDGFPIRFEKK